ncbi:glucose / sorbosone dehydrogenase [Halalkalicoccus paucihalophilus]|uniref:Glucose / sorbosone dehydrogenase n=1 Tax=Halalkalicoccus paucihalophilus TaxID=1008153 RepID=A0A151ADA4_9EURY|nr:PQQ-dependent sugar dehydrogenase [Halalkalicoccus paucihalophilus]KYH25648.1 glucose / sorbosone dehydrogenase [Halalkalicoccus paucihalophilus]
MSQRARRTATRRRFLRSGAAIGALSVAGCVGPSDDEPGSDTGDGNGTAGDESDGESGGYEIETVAEGFANPWALEFLPDDGMLVTEREGRLSIVDREDGTAETVGGVPDVYAAGQGGLLDVALHPTYPDEPWVYLTYSGANDAGESATHLGRGRLDLDGGRLEGFEVLHVAGPFVDSDGHFGSRLLVEDDALYMTAGDRQLRGFGPDHVAQDTTNELGSTLRLGLDGSVPVNNPFVDTEGAVDTIYSYGHRNPQAMTTHPETGAIWQAEHGEEDGDEINVIEAGGNYGWPVATYACEYGTDDPVGERPEEREDTVAPVHYWECGSGGFPPSGMAFYDGEAFPDWQGNLFVGTLAGEYLGRFAVDGRSVAERGLLLEGEGWRVRDVAVAPETGHIYVAVDAEDAPVVRLRPA